MNLFFGKNKYHTRLFLIKNFQFLKLYNIGIHYINKTGEEIVKLKNNNSLNICNILGLLRCKRILDLVFKSTD